jgi:hypothetical protein
MSVPVYSFKNQSGMLEYGVIAQELETVYPELVYDHGEQGHFRAVNYIGLLTPVIRTIQEQQKILVQQSAEIQALLTEMEALE